MDRFIIHPTGADDDALLDGLRWLMREARKSQGCEGGIYVSNLASTGSLRRVLGAHASVRLRDSRSLSVDGVVLKLVLRRRRPSWYPHPVFVPWASDSLINEAEEMRPSAVCATGDVPGELDDWQRVHGPTDVRTGQPIVAAEVPSLAIDGAVEMLTRRINDDVVHPRDRERAVRVFKALRLCEREVDPEIVRAVALRKDWAPDAAGRLMAIAEGIADGRALRGGKVTKTEAKALVARFEEHGAT